MTLIIIVLFIFLILDYSKLKDRVNTLEQQISKDGKPNDKALETFTPLPLPVSHNRLTPFPELQSESTHFAPTVLSYAKSETSLLRWFKEDPLIKIGGGIFFLGVAWFVTYAIESGWLSPGLRITFGLVLAFCIYILGYYRQVVSKNQYLVLTVLGTGIICATMFSAQIVFAMFNPILALLLISLSIAYTIYVSLRTNSKWLLLVSALFGLFTPLLSLVDHQVIPTLTYLLVLTVSILLAGFKTSSKTVTLLLLVGIIFFENLFFASNTTNSLWLFVILFSLLFFASVTLALFRQPKPQAIDVATMLIIGVNYVATASLLSANSSVATFAAALVVGGMGYYLTMRQKPSSVISIYLALGAGLIIIGTSFLFSGYSLALAYIIEFTLAFCLVTQLGLPSLVIWTSASLYLIPLLGSLPSYFSPSWRFSLWHPDAWVLYAMTLSLLGSALWLIHKPSVAVYRWSKVIATIFGVLWFFYFYGVLAVLAESLFISSEAVVMTYVSWALLSLCVVFYSLRNNLPLRVTFYSAISVLLPVLVSLESFSSQGWSLGFSHPDGLGTLGIFVVILLITLLLTQQFCKEYDTTLRRFIAGFLVLLVSYLFAIFVFYWHGVLTPALATVAIYFSFAVVLYGLTSLFVLLRTTVSWIGYSLAGLALPIGISLSSFSFIGFKGGVMAPEAVGLFAMSVFFVMLALGLRRHYNSAHREDQSFIQNWSRGLLLLAFVYATSFTWCMAHTISGPTQAITLSLFIYTIVGLFAYQYGKRHKKTDVTYAGVTLLSLVVLHLILVDIWKMELIWQVITFLVIGAMFIATAMMETRNLKPKSK